MRSVVVLLVLLLSVGAGALTFVLRASPPPEPVATPAPPMGTVKPSPGSGSGGGGAPGCAVPNRCSIGGCTFQGSSEEDLAAHEKSAHGPGSVPPPVRATPEKCPRCGAAGKLEPATTVAGNYRCSACGESVTAR